MSIHGKAATASRLLSASLVDDIVIEPLEGALAFIATNGNFRL